MTLNEMFRGQGIDPGMIVRAPMVSDAQLGGMIGNAMSQTVLGKLFWPSLNRLHIQLVMKINRLEIITWLV